MKPTSDYLLRPLRSRAEVDRLCREYTNALAIKALDTQVDFDDLMREERHRMDAQWAADQDLLLGED